MLLPLIDTAARWTGPLACLDESLEPSLPALPDGASPDEHAAHAAPVEALHAQAYEATMRYLQTGEPYAESTDAPTVTLRPLSAIEEAQAEADAGPPVGLAAFAYQRIAEAAARSGRPDDPQAWEEATLDLPPKMREALHLHAQREDRVRLARIRRALVAATYVPEGVDPVAALDRVADLALRRSLIQEVVTHLDRIGRLSAEGKARAGRP